MRGHPQHGRRRGARHLEQEPLPDELQAKGSRSANKGTERRVSNARCTYKLYAPRGEVNNSLLRIPVIGSIACGDQRLNCSMRGSMAEFIKD